MLNTSRSKCTVALDDYLRLEIVFSSTGIAFGGFTGLPSSFKGSVPRWLLIRNHIPVARIRHMIFAIQSLVGFSFTNSCASEEDFGDAFTELFFG